MNQTSKLKRTSGQNRLDNLLEDAPILAGLYAAQIYERLSAVARWTREPEIRVDCQETTQEFSFEELEGVLGFASNMGLSMEKHLFLSALINALVEIRIVGPRTQVRANDFEVFTGNGVFFKEVKKALTVLQVFSVHDEASDQLVCCLFEDDLPQFEDGDDDADDPVSDEEEDEDDDIVYDEDDDDEDDEDPEDFTPSQRRPVGYDS